MKRWLLYALALGAIIAFGISPFTATDVGKLRPVEVVRLSQKGSQVYLQTDTGDMGAGENVDAALENLKASTAGEIFLETADHLLLEPGSEKWLKSIAVYLRPSCSICWQSGELELEEAAKYLSAHRPQITLQDWMAGRGKIPSLKTQKERMELVQ